MKLRLAALISMIATGAVAAPIETPVGVLSLEDCLRLAESAPSAVHLAAQGRRVAQYGVQGAVGAFLPRIHWNSGLTLNTVPAGTNQPLFVALNGAREYTSVIEAAMDVDLSGRLRSGLARATADRDAADASADLLIRDLRRAVGAAYYRALLTRRIALSTRDSFKEAQAFEARTRVLVAGGEAAQADTARAALQSSVLEQAVSAADLDVQLANQDLASFWTTDVGAPLALDDALAKSLPAPPVVESGAPTTVYLMRPELRIFAAQERSLMAEYRRLRADLLPQLNVKYQYGFDALDYSWRDRGHALFVTLSVPIFDFFQTTSVYKPLELRANMIALERQIAERGLSRDYQSAVARLQGLYQQINITGKQTQTAAENLRLSRLRYDGGEGSALEVVSAQSQLNQARASYFSAQAGYLNAHADLRVATGK